MEIAEIAREIAGLFCAGEFGQYGCMDRNLIARGFGLPGGVILMGAAHSFIRVNGLSRTGLGEKAWHYEIETAVIIGAIYFSVALFFHFRWYWIHTRHAQICRRGQIAAVLIFLAAVTQAFVGSYLREPVTDAPGTISPQKVIGAQK